MSAFISDPDWLAFHPSPSRPAFKLPPGTATLIVGFHVAELSPVMALAVTDEREDA